MGDGAPRQVSMVAGIPQGIGEDLLERLLLGSEGNGRRRAQAGVDEFGVQLLGIFGKIQEAVDVGGTVVEGREQEAGHGRLHPPVPGPFFFLEKYRRLWMSEERSLKAGNRKPVMGGCTHQSLGRSSMRLVASL